jgi:ribokinase
MAQVVCVGHATVDYLGQVDKYPELDRKEEIQAFSLQGGGPAATAACAVATLGGNASFVGKVSDDEFGDFIKLGLAGLGVDISRVVTEPGLVSPWAFIAVEARSARRTIFWTKGDVSSLREDEVAATVLDGARVLLVDGHHPAAQLALVKLARQRGIEVVREHSTCVVASERFAAEVEGGIDKALAHLRRGGPRCAVITLGEDGAVGVEGDDDPIIAAAHAVTPVDTTGAGDVFHGAFCHALLQGWDLRRRLEFANCAAALSTRALGGRAALPRLEEVEAALRGA